MRCCIAALTLSFFFISTIASAQSVKAFYETYSKVRPGMQIDVHNKDLFRAGGYSPYPMYYYRVKAPSTLYGRPVQKVEVQTTETDTIKEVSIYLPFDTLLHRQMELELGQGERGWMAFRSNVDTANVIWTRYWDLENYTVEFRCTRYDYVIGDIKEDLMVVSLLPKRKQQTAE